MKRSILMLLVIGVAMIFFGCEKMDPLVPDSNSDQEITSLKSARVSTPFKGICTPTAPPNPGDNAWYDATSDWRVTGTTIWVQPDLAKFEGTCELFVDGENPGDPFRGIWNMNWSGEIIPTENGMKLLADAVGIGVAGEVEGLTATWTYTMDYVGDWPPDPPNSTFFYSIKGKITDESGRNKKNMD